MTKRAGHFEQAIAAAENHRREVVAKVVHPNMLGTRSGARLVDVLAVSAPMPGVDPEAQSLCGIQVRQTNLRTRIVHLIGNKPGFASWDSSALQSRVVGPLPLRLGADPRSIRVVCIQDEVELLGNNHGRYLQ